VRIRNPVGGVKVILLKIYPGLMKKKEVGDFTLKRGFCPSASVGLAPALQPKRV
jgi:hypothetical protein